MRRYLLIVLLLACAPRSEARYSGGSGSVENPYLIGTAQDLVDLGHEMEDWSRCFRQIADIDMNDLPGAETCPIGNGDLPFSGVFDGGGKAIANFTCTCGGANSLGLFGQVRGYEAEIRNVVLTDPNVDSETSEYVGALVGRLSSGAVLDCRVVDARVTGHMGVGGLVGWTRGGIVGCEVTGVVRGAFSVGGLTGVTFWGEDIRNCRTYVIVTGTNRVGGLVGSCTLASIHWCSASGSVEGAANVGGLLGCSEGGVVTNCYATASVTGGSYVGGLVGRNALSCDCSAGALPGEIIHCYATGLVTGADQTGGLVGDDDDCLVQDAFWDIETSGLKRSDGGMGLTTAELESQHTFVSGHWDFVPQSASGDYWVMRGSGRYPRPAWEIVVGDYDNDGAVNLRDFAALALHWRMRDADFWMGGTDLTGDERIDALDLQALCRPWPVEAWDR